MVHVGDGVKVLLRPLLAMKELVTMLRKHFDGLVSCWTHPGRLGALRGRCFAVITVLVVILGLLSGMMNIESSFASGSAEIRQTSQVVFIDASTDDPPGTPDPGYDKDVASCTAQVQNETLVLVSIHNGYPSYTCTFSTTIHNSNTLPTCLESLEFSVPPALTVMEQRDPADLVLKPGEQTVQVFSVRVGQSAKPATAYGFRISEVFRAMESGRSVPCMRKVSP
ncbi:hypothetical protein ANRL2_02567 [Anaerolineae bacterium]|nr:hypothetical protein ANRL2_02567 [Anaerolineae bacterium]